MVASCASTDLGSNSVESLRVPRHMRGRVVHSNSAEGICVSEIEYAELGVAESRIAFACMASNTGPSRSGRARDDAQHLRGRGLLLLRLGELAPA